MLLQTPCTKQGDLRWGSVEWGARSVLFHQHRTFTFTGYVPFTSFFRTQLHAHFSQAHVLRAALAISAATPFKFRCDQHLRCFRRILLQRTQGTALPNGSLQGLASVQENSRGLVPKNWKAWQGLMWALAMWSLYRSRSTTCSRQSRSIEGNFATSQCVVAPLAYGKSLFGD